MPATAASDQAPAVQKPKHPLHALTTYELTGYRRQLEHAIAFFARQYPVPPVQTDLQAALRDVCAAQQSRQEAPRA
jgi:hypothetical protein